MRIVVIGAGAVGSYLAKRLSDDGQDVVVIEDSEKRVAELKEQLDAFVIHGNGASTKVLLAAGVDQADLLIAVSNSDGANVLACHAGSELGVKRTVARIEDPEIREGARRLGVDVIIDPSASMASELVSLVGLGGVSELIPFADGKLVMVGGTITQNAPLTQGPLRQLRLRRAEWGWVVAALVRDGRTIVAHGDTVLQAGDHALVMTTDDAVDHALELLGLEKRPLDRAVVIGSTRLASLIAKMMREAKLDVVMLEGDPERCRRLSAEHPQALVLCGDPTDPAVVSDVELGRRDVVLAVTGWDEINILACLVAKAMGAGSVIARFHRTEYVSLLAGIGIDAAVSTRLSAASAILRYVRQGRIEQVATFSDTDAEAIETEVAAGSSAVGKTLEDLDLPVGVVIGGISRGGTTFVPDGSTVVRAGDHIIFFAIPRDIAESSKLFMG